MGNKKRPIIYQVLVMQKFVKYTGDELLKECRAYIKDYAYLHHYYWIRYEECLPEYTAEKLRSAAEQVGNHCVRITACTLAAFLEYKDHRFLNQKKEWDQHHPTQSLLEMKQRIEQITQTEE
jgi:hypothetical protein